MVHQLLQDEFRALYGVPAPNPTHARDAVETALAIVEELYRRVEGRPLESTGPGFGIHSGIVVAGMIGTDVKQTYRVMGDAVNLASRIEQLNKEFASALLVSQVVMDRLDAHPACASDLGTGTIRGRSEAVRLYRLA